MRIMLLLGQRRETACLACLIFCLFHFSHANRLGEQPVCEAGDALSNNGELCQPVAEHVLLGEYQHDDYAASCRLYATSPAYRSNTSPAIITRVPLEKDQLLLDGDLADPLIRFADANLNEAYAWHDALLWPTESLLPGSHLQNDFLTRLVVPGIVATQARCALDERLINLELHVREEEGTVSSVNASLRGSLEDSLQVVYKATRSVQSGEELVIKCREDNASRIQLTSATPIVFPQPYDWDKEEHTGRLLCMDSLITANTINNNDLSDGISGVGRRASTRRAVDTGSIVAATPVIPLHRSQLDIPRQGYYSQLLLNYHNANNNTISHIPSEVASRRSHTIVYQDRETIGQQLLLNYVLGHVDSDIVLLPTAPNVHYINHDSQSPNVYLRWTKLPETKRPNDWNYYYHTLSALQLLDQPVVGQGAGMMILEIVALRPLEEGEEVVMDYGRVWEEAMQEHLDSFDERAALQRQKNYLSAFAYRRQADTSQPLIRTLEQQETHPYPDNLATACRFTYSRKAEYFWQRDSASYQAAPNEQPPPLLAWDPSKEKCLRYCDVLSYNESSQTYTAKIFARANGAEHVEATMGCGNLPTGGVTVRDIPAEAVTVIDKPYTLDFQQPRVFRHYISTPDTLFPMTWRRKDPRPDGDFIPSPLGPGDIDVIRWADTGKVVTPNAHRIGLPPSVSKTLIDYCERMNIVDIFRHLTVDGNSLDIGTNTFLTLDDQKWYIQRPAKQWASNLQWLSPGNHEAHVHYLEALSLAGFDQVLQAIGEHFEMDGLVAFHLTFMAVSHSTKGYMHFDVTQTQAKAFNVIIPLMLANETGPELDLQGSSWIDEDDEEDEYEDEDEESSDDLRAGRYRYEPNIASMMGDDALHASSAVDYRSRKEMRMAATVYVAGTYRVGVTCLDGT